MQYFLLNYTDNAEHLSEKNKKNIYFKSVVGMRQCVESKPGVDAQCMKWHVERGGGEKLSESNYIYLCSIRRFILDIIYTLGFGTNFKNTES